MRSAVWLIGLLGFSACSLDHIMVAALDDESAGSGPVAFAGRANLAGSGGWAGEVSLPASSAGSGGSLPIGGMANVGDAGSVWTSSGGVDNFLIGTIITDSGGTSETRCSCVGRDAEVCGSDGLTYPRDCGDAGSCAPPEIACLQACPCPDGSAGSAGTGAFTWLSTDCAATERCRDGVVCMTFDSSTLDGTTCTTSN